jgi:hypothetical protein
VLWRDCMPSICKAAGVKGHPLPMSTWATDRGLVRCLPPEPAGTTPISGISPEPLPIICSPISAYR